ncbi:MAG TPA: hypothetical protein VEU30_13485 [Thermoanaerobaculia bacterium]|nr:hypothetical protein [Thermoanaerobaculia bacterium]
MQSSGLRAWWKFVRVLVALYVAGVCASVAISPVRYGEEIRAVVGLKGSGADPEWQLVEQLWRDIDRTQPARTTLRVMLGRDNLSARCRAALPRHVFDRIQQTTATLRNHHVLEDMLVRYCGRGYAAGRRMDLETYRFFVAEGQTEGLVEVTYTALPYSEVLATAGPGDRTFELTVSPPDLFERHDFTIELITQGAYALAGNATPLLQTETQTVLQGEVARMERPLRVRIVPPNDVIAPPKPRRRQVSEVVGALRDAYTPVAEPITDALLASLPFLLILAIRRERELTDIRGSERLFGFAYAAALLFAGIGLFRAADDLTRWTGDEATRFPCGWALNSAGAPPLLVAYVFTLWPLLVSRCRNCVRLPITPARRSLILLVAAIVLSVAAGGLAAYTCTIDAISRWAFAIAGVAAFLALLAAISEVVDGLWRQLLFTILTLAGAALFFVVEALTRDLPWFLVAAPFVAPMFYTMARLMFPRVSRSALILAAVAAALVLSYGKPDYNPWKPWLISAIGFDLARTSMLFAAGLLIWLLYHLSRTGKWHKLERGEHAVATVLMLLMFFVRWDNVVYAAIATAAGCAVMRYWIFVRRRIQDAADPNVHATIRDLIRLNEMESALRALKREMRSKLSKAEVGFHDYAMKVDALEAHVDQQRQKVSARPDLPPAAVLSSGPPVAPWKRGVESARYGLLFGIPWIVLFLREVHNYVAPQYVSDWGATLAAVIHVVAAWPLLGFVFGYFYPHLRGDTGISKGLYLFIAVTIPLFAATALASPASNAGWKALAYYALQLFIHCLFLGLVAGDYATLRASGLRWRHVIDVDNLGGVTAWGSSMVFALATAATTFTPATVANFANVVVSGVVQNIGAGEDAARRNDAPRIVVKQH